MLIGQDYANTLREDFNIQPNGEVVFDQNQYLSDDFWDELQSAKDNFAFRHEGLTNVASIPEAVVNRWIREGFDFWSAPANEIIRKLRMEELDKFIISGDATFDH